MSRFLIDSNVLSELWKPVPDPKVLNFLDEAEWYIPAPVIAEIQAGAEALPSAARRAAINGRLDALLREVPLSVADWDAETSRTWGRLQYSREVRRRPQALWDSLIDAMGVRFDAQVATGNPQDFRHAKTFNPWSEQLPL